MKNLKENRAKVRTIIWLKRIGFNKEEIKDLLKTTGVKNIIKDELKNID